MRTKTKHKVSASAPRLSDEDIDPIEKDDVDSATHPVLDSWLMWEPDDIEDIRKIIETKMPKKQSFVIEAFLNGLTYSDISVTEKYWRYHFVKGVEFLKKELRV